MHTAVVRTALILVLGMQEALRLGLRDPPIVSWTSAWHQVVQPVFEVAVGLGRRGESGRNE